jgi:hypothetical protein
MELFTEDSLYVQAAMEMESVVDANFCKIGPFTHGGVLN